MTKRYNIYPEDRHAIVEEFTYQNPDDDSDQIISTVRWNGGNGKLEVPDDDTEFDIDAVRKNKNQEWMPYGDIEDFSDGYTEWDTTRAKDMNEWDSILEEAETLEDELEERGWDDPESETTIEGKLIVEKIKSS